MRIQIAFDYLIVFIFVLLVFTIVFYAISKQRVEAATQQSFSQLQLIGQTIASEITTAGQSGNGYSALLPLPGAVGILQYNVSITRSGGVIVSSNAFGQLVSTYSPTYSSFVISNASYLSSGGQYYSIPTYTGDGYISIENSYGTVCVDYACPSSLAQPSQLIVTTKSLYALKFNGVNTKLQLPYVSSLGKQQTVSLWIYPYQSSGTSQIVYDEGSSSANYNWISYQSNAITAGTSSGAGDSCTSSAVVLPGEWYLVTLTSNSPGLSLYLDGSATGGCKASTAAGFVSDSITIGAASYPSGGSPFNGLISNIQIYGSALSAQNVTSLWTSGVSGSPLLQPNQSSILLATRNLSAWWPLDGNPNDYSGNGYNLVSTGPGLYITGSQLFATVRNYTGDSIPGALVAFYSGASSLSSAWSYNGAASASGVAAAAIVPLGTPGISNIKATVFSGNASTANALAAWWPLNEGQGVVAYDGAASTYSGAPNGNVIGAAWASPNYVMSLNGRSGYVQLPDPSALQLSSLTVSGWVYLYGPSAGSSGFIFSKQGAYDVGICGSSLSVCYYDWGSANWYTSSADLPAGRWYMLTATLSGGTEKVYVNGAQVLSGPAAVASQSYGPRLGYGANGQALNGSLSNVQLYSNALTQQQIYSLYTEGMAGTPLAGASAVGWWPLDGSTNDYSGNGYNGTAYGGFSYKAYPGVQYNASHTLSAGFTGTSYIYGSSALAEVQNLTVSAWIDPSATNACGTVFSTLPVSAVSGYALEVNTISDTTYFDYGSQPGVQRIGFSGTPYANDAWYYVAATFSNGTVDLYINGVPVNSTASHNNVIQYLQGGWSIGSLVGAPSCGFDGQISDVQVYGSALSGSQIASLYAQGAAAFPLSSAGLAAWWPLNGNANDYSSGHNNGIAAGVTYYSQSFISPPATPSMSGFGLYFGGSGDKVVASTGVPLPGPSFSVSAWVHPTALRNGNEEAVVGQSGAYQLVIGNASNSEADFMAYSGGRWISADSPKSLQPDSWYMLTGVYNSTRALLYIDGKLAATSDVTGSFASPNAPTIIGAGSTSPYTSYYFTGTIADVQVYSKQLSPEQVSQLYSDGMPLSDAVTTPSGSIT